MNSYITGSSSIVDGSIGGFRCMICYVVEVDMSMCKGRQGATLEGAAGNESRSHMRKHVDDADVGVIL